MTRSHRIATAVAALASACPAFAHVTRGGAPHWHAGDAWGIVTVAALTGIAAWIDRRRRR